MHACRLTREHGTRRVLALPDVLGGRGGGGALSHGASLSRVFCPRCAGLEWSMPDRTSTFCLQFMWFAGFLHTSGFIFHGDILHHISPYSPVFLMIVASGG